NFERRRWFGPTALGSMPLDAAGAAGAEMDEKQVVLPFQHLFQLPPQALHFGPAQSAAEERVLNPLAAPLELVVRQPPALRIADVVAHKVPAPVAMAVDPSHQRILIWANRPGLPLHSFLAAAARVRWRDHS